MKNWLNHFETFEDYVDFLMLNDFVFEKRDKDKSDKKEYVPIDIFKSNLAMGYIRRLNQDNISSHPVQKI